MSVRTMTAAEFEAWRVHQIASYAAEMTESGALPQLESEARASEQLRELLPHGPATPGMRLLRVLDEADAVVGVLWLGPHPQRAGAGWVYDVEIDESRRGEGLGRAVMTAAEDVARDAGWSELGLNVFGPNARARTLYDSLGYRVVNTHMTKSLPEPPA